MAKGSLEVLAAPEKPRRLLAILPSVSTTGSSSQNKLQSPSESLLSRCFQQLTHIYNDIYEISCKVL